MRALRPLILASLFAAAGAAAAGAEWYDALRWRSIGPFRGGRVLAVAGDPGDRLHFYFGSVNGGVWETRDAGRTWRPIFDGQPVGSIGALALAPSDPRVLYVGTGEADMRSDIAQGDGMFKSIDGGATWRAIGLADSQQIGRILVDPRDAGRVFVAALGHPYGPNAERGVFRSTDGGAHWSKVLGPDENTGAIDLAFEPGRPEVVYAALWATRRTPWSVYPPSNGPGSGVFKSVDGGDSWAPLSGRGGLPAAHGRVGLAVAPSLPGRVYALVDAEPDGGLYRSDDAGATWRKTTGDTRLWQRGWYFGRVEVDPSDPDRVWVMNTVLLESTDGGASFVPVAGDPTGDDYHDLWIDPRDPARRITGTDQGAVVTLNGGATWSSWHNQPTAQIYHLSTDDRFPYWVYGSQQDSGAVGLPSRTTHRAGITVREFREVTAGGESDNVVPDPLDPDVIWGGRVERYDLRTRQTREVDPTLAHPDVHRSAWTLPLAFSKRDPRVLYFANQRIYRTADGGETWRPISPDLTREDPGTPPNLDPATAATNPRMGPRRGVVYALAPSRLADGDLWAGTDDGRVWRTRDEGAHWLDVTPPGLEPWSKVGIVEASPHDAETAYLAVDRHRLDDFRPYVYRTRDGGSTWELVVAGIASTHCVNVVREDPARRGLLYAGTERGVYVSFDDGARWRPLQMNLPATSVRDLEVKGDDLVAATHGRGFWILDDLSPLRQFTPEVAGAGAWLFAPARALRVRPEGFTGTPLPKEEPAAPNPPVGAVIDYLLSSAPSAPVVLSIFDARGELVRRYRSDERRAPVDPSRLHSAPEWVKTPQPPDAGPGLHRFVWPLRYPAAPPLAGGDPFVDGVWAPPGRYRIELEVDGVRLAQPLELAPDPRVDLPAAAYAEQFALARRIEAERARVSAAASDARDLQSALSERRGRAVGRLAAELATFQDRLTTVTGVVPAANPSNSWWLPPRSLTSLRALAGALDGLAGAVDGADAAPSPDARAGFESALLRVEEGLAAWERLRAAEVPALDRKLRRAGLAPLGDAPPR